MNNFYLILYVVAWAVTFFFYQKKKRHLDVGGIIILSFLTYSVASLALYNSSYKSMYNDLSLFPFIYLYLMLMLALLPILNYNDRKINRIQKPSKVLFNSIIVLYILASLVDLTGTLPDLYKGLVTIVIDSAAGLEIYRETMGNSFDTGDGAISNLFAIFSNLLSDIGILIFFYYLTLGKKNKFILFGLFVSIIASVLSPIAASQRGPAVERLLTIIIAYFTLRKFIPLKINKTIQRIGIVLLIIISIPIGAITVSRFGEREGGAMGSVSLYVGQQNLNFNKYGFDNNGLRYGDRTFPLFKKMLGFDNVPNNFWERRSKYTNLKINDEVFIGFVGDFVLDFGPFISFFIFVIFTCFVLYRTRIRKNRILFHQLILLYFVICVCFQGGMKLYSFADTGGNLRLITFILVYFTFKLDYSIRRMQTSHQIN